MMKKLIFMCMAVALATGSVAFGNTTSALWTFSDSSLNPVPDDFSNPYGSPQLEVVSCYWMDIIDGHTGVFPLSGQIDVYLPNSRVTDSDTYKNILLTLTWKPNVVDTILPEAPLVAVDPYVEMESSRSDEDLGNGWIQTTFIITIWPNPVEEWFTIKGDIMVDELSINTECIPEPTTLGLFGLGALALLRKRKA